MGRGPDEGIAKVELMFEHCLMLGTLFVPNGPGPVLATLANFLFSWCFQVLGPQRTHAKVQGS